jgi:hypothetical protein
MRISKTAYTGEQKGPRKPFPCGGWVPECPSNAYWCSADQRQKRYDAVFADQSCYYPDVPFTPENAKAMRARSHGLRRAEFWRALGFPNIELANAARRLNAARRREEKHG